MTVVKSDVSDSESKYVSLCRMQEQCFVEVYCLSPDEKR
jgi:hypothetical protein